MRTRRRGGRPVSACDDLRKPRHVQDGSHGIRLAVAKPPGLSAEALGTFLFFFLGFNAVAVASDLGDGAISTLGVAFAFGLGLTARRSAALGHVSGGHFNPAVSLGLAAARRFPPKEVIPYSIAQLIGGFVAVLAVAAVYPGHAVDALTTAPSPRITSGGAFILEFIVTGLFVMVITTVAMDKRAPWQGVMAPLLIGLFIFVAADAVGPASGGSPRQPRQIARPGALQPELQPPIWIYARHAPLSFAPSSVERSAPCSDPFPMRASATASALIRHSARRTQRWTRQGPRPASRDGAGVTQRALKRRPINLEGGGQHQSALPLRPTPDARQSLAAGPQPGTATAHRTRTGTVRDRWRGFWLRLRTSLVNDQFLPPLGALQSADET